MIVIPRSNTYFGRITLTDGANTVLLDSTDKMIFAVKKKPNDENEEALIKKTITSDREIEGGYGFELTPEETDLPAGTYFYDVGIQRANGEFYHVTQPDRFIIKQSVSRKED